MHACSRLKSVFKLHVSGLILDDSCGSKIRGGVPGILHESVRTVFILRMVAAGYVVKYAAADITYM